MNESVKVNSDVQKRSEKLPVTKMTRTRDAVRDTGSHELCSRVYPRFPKESHAL